MNSMAQICERRAAIRHEVNLIRAALRRLKQTCGDPRQTDLLMIRLGNLFIEYCGQNVMSDRLFEQLQAKMV